MRPTILLLKKYPNVKSFENQWMEWLHAFWSKKIWSTDIWPIDIWPIDIWLTDIWLTDIWLTDIWPIDIWPTDIWPTDIWPTGIWLTDIWLTQCYVDKALARSFDRQVLGLFYDTAMAENPYLRERLSTVDHLVITSSYQLISKLKILFTVAIKQAALMRRSTVLSLSLQLVFPGCGYSWQVSFKLCCPNVCRRSGFRPKSAEPHRTSLQAGWSTIPGFDSTSWSHNIS